MSSLTTVSMGARASEKSMKPMMIGRTLKNPKSAYKDLLLTKLEKRAKM